MRTRTSSRRAEAVANAEAEVCSAIARALALDVHDVRVSVEHGALTLSGTVEDHYAKDLVGELARRAAGVVEVRNLLVVSPEWGEERRPLETEFADASSAKAVMAVRFRLSDSL
jgi:hypothetical protein